jgi:hypothetical protein
MSRIAKALLFSLLAVTATGCVVEAEPARPPPPPCNGELVWARGWHDRGGYWHERGWVCRAPRAVIIVR